MAGETLLNNRYLLMAQQGSGGMAVIYKARDQLLGRVVAIKILRPSLTADPAFIARFQNEARAIANLQHPNIVTVHDVGTHVSPPNMTHYIVMEFVEGSDLKRIIKTENQLSVERALHFAMQICDGIGYAHRAGIVHADVKPQNILVTVDHKVKVTDFGIAQALTDTQPQQREAVVWGSPHYFAPEQAKGEKPTAASDVYAIGIVMFEMLTGRLPYMGTTQQELAMAHIKEAVPQVNQFNPQVGELLNQLVTRAMSKDPAARFRDADQLGSALRRLQSQGEARTLGSASAGQPAAQTASSTAPPATLPGVPAAPRTVPGMPAASQPASAAQTAQPRTPPVPPTLPQAPISEPTQRAPIAPEAPNSPGYGRSGQGGRVNPGAVGNEAPLVDNRSLQRQYPQPPAPQPPPPQAGGYSGQTVYDSRPYTPPPHELSPSQAYYPQGRRDAPSIMDTVTIVLAVLAFFAVACLIPLYIAVAQAYAGG